MELIEEISQLDKNTLVIAGGAFLIALSVIAAKHERGLAAAASFGVLIVVVGLRYYYNQCDEGEFRYWKTCVPEEAVTAPQPVKDLLFD